MSEAGLGARQWSDDPSAGRVILMMKNSDLAWILGTLVGISFLFSGIDMLGFSAGFHSKNYDLSRGYRFK